MNAHYDEIRKHLNERRVALGLRWEGDNRRFVLDEVLPALKCRPQVLAVLNVAYGNGVDAFCSFEGLGNGSSVVRDKYFRNQLKDPFGTGHDMLFLLHHAGIPLPCGLKTLHDCNDWYDDCMEDFGYDRLDDVRRLGLFLFSWPFWIGLTFEAQKYRRLRKLGLTERMGIIRKWSGESFPRLQPA